MKAKKNHNFLSLLEISQTLHNLPYSLLPETILLSQEKCSG